jgi:hypothetical protein
VYAGKDPLTGRELRLRKTRRTEVEAQIEPGKLLELARAGRQSDSDLTVAELLEVVGEQFYPKQSASCPPVCPCRQYRYSAPGLAMMLWTRFVGEIAMMCVSSTEAWNGGSSTARDTPAGVVTTAIRKATAKAMTSVQAVSGTSPR